MEYNLSADLLRGHVDTMILKLLFYGDKYGYEICKLISRHSEGKYELKEATLYSSLRRLEQEEKISSYWGNESQGGRRKYYKINSLGKKAYMVNVNNWEYAKKILDKLIGVNNYD